MFAGSLGSCGNPAKMDQLEPESVLTIFGQKNFTDFLHIVQFEKKMFFMTYNLFVTSKKRNHEFSNSRILKCYKMSFKAFKTKRQGLKCFSVIKKK